jgi:hypothetical protein
LTPWGGIAARRREKQLTPPVSTCSGSGQLVRFTGARELAEFLAESEETQRSFVRQLFHHMVQQPVLAWGPEAVDDLSKAFAGGKFQMQELQAEIAVRAALQGWSVSAPATAAVSSASGP